MSHLQVMFSTYIFLTERECSRSFLSYIDLHSDIHTKYIYFDFIRPKCVNMSWILYVSLRRYELQLHAQQIQDIKEHQQKCSVWKTQFHTSDTICVWNSACQNVQ